jgi:peroxiredoxin
MDLALPKGGRGRKRTVKTLLLLALAAGGSQAAKPLAIGDPVPDLELTDLAGKTVKLSELRARTPSGVVTLTFWCTFCHSCRMMDAKFKALAADFKGKAAVAGVDASAADDAKKIEDFARAKAFDVPVFFDAAGKAADLFGVRLTTTTVVIDKAGTLRYRGAFDAPGAPHARAALTAVLEGKGVSVPETAAQG